MVYEQKRLARERAQRFKLVSTRPLAYEQKHLAREAGVCQMISCAAPLPCSHKHARTGLHAFCSCACTHTLAHVCTHMPAHARTHTRARARAHEHTHTRARMHAGAYLPAQTLHFVTTRQTRERDKRAVMGLLGGSWDAALDGGDPQT